MSQSYDTSSWTSVGSSRLSPTRARFQEHPYSTCRCRQYCEFERLKEAQRRLPQTKHKEQWLAMIHRNRSTAQKRALEDPRALLKEFFGEYELSHRYKHQQEFRYNPSRPIMSEFHRMCHIFGWKKPQRKEVALKKEETSIKEKVINSEYLKAHDKFKDVLSFQFNALYGTDEDDLSSWQNLCCVLNLPNIPRSLEACRTIVGSIHVNIIDLIDTPVTQVPIIRFKNEEQLSKYTLHTGKKFPRDNVESGDLLRFLLRRIDAYDFCNVKWGYDEW